MLLVIDVLKSLPWTPVMANAHDPSQALEFLSKETLYSFVTERILRFKLETLSRRFFESLDHRIRQRVAASFRDAQSLREAKPDPFRSPYASLKAKGYKYPFTTLGEECRFSLLLEAHCIALELKYQNQALKSGQHSQILNETRNKTKIEKEIDVLETMNIELEHSVAKLRKENETLKQHYKDLYDSIKITRSKTTEQTTSLLANNAELKAQIQEKVFAIASLKNDLRKLKGNSVDTKFDKTSVLGKPVLPSLRNQSVVRQLNAFKYERAQISKHWFASQVDVNKNLLKPVTQHYLPNKTESAFTKPDHMIASSSSRNSSKNMPRFSSNDMVHNHYLDVAKKKIQERDRNSTTRATIKHLGVLPVSRVVTYDNGLSPKQITLKSSSSFSDSKRFVCSTCHKCVFNANHDAYITKLLKEVNSRAKIQSHKTKNSNKPVDQKSYTQKPGRQIFTGHKFSPNKTSAVYEKTSPRSDLRWKPTGLRISNLWSLAQVDQGSQIKMIQVKEMMQDNDLKNLKSKDKGSKSRSQSMDEQSHYKQDKTITRQSINVKRHIFNVIGDTEKFEERDLNIGGDC
ncbi:hypothetical protein Tco_1419317 [Tanacetum coccineum]